MGDEHRINRVSTKTPDKWLDGCPTKYTHAVLRCDPHKEDNQ